MIRTEEGWKASWKGHRVTKVYCGGERIGLIYFDDGARPAPYDFVPTLTAADRYPRLRGIIMGGSVEQLVSRVEAAM